jgi:hypothetical protein
MWSEVQLFSISRRTRISPSLPSCFMFPRDAFLNDGEDLGSSSSSITFEAAGVTILCLFVPLLKPRDGCATFRIAPSVACFISGWSELLSIFSFLLLMLVIVKEPCSILVASAPAVKCQKTPEKNTTFEAYTKQTMFLCQLLEPFQPGYQQGLKAEELRTRSRKHQHFAKTRMDFLAFPSPAKQSRLIPGGCSLLVCRGWSNPA